MAVNPRLRRGVTITRRAIGEEEIYYLVREPVSGSFLRMGEAEAAVLRLLDGTRSPAQVVEALDAAHGIRVGRQVLDGFIADMTRRGLLESRDFDPAAFRQEWLQAERARSRSLGRLLGSLTYFKVKLINPDRFMTAVSRRLGFVFTPAFVAATLILMALAAAAAFWHREAIGRDLFSYLHAGAASAGSFAWHAGILYLVFILVVAVHESSHGLTCAHFGGKVTDMGVSVMYLQVFCLYCDVTDAYAFERRGHRLWTTVAGGYSGLVLASLGVFLWWATETGDLLNEAALMLMVIGGPPLLALNWNPLIRLDGYYILMDLLEAPNLMDNSMKYLGHVIKSKVLRVPVEPRDVPPRLRRVYLIYGMCALFFIAPLVVYMPVIAYYLVGGLLGEGLALLASAAVAWRIWSKLARQGWGTLRYAWLSHRPRLQAAGEAGRARLGLLGAGGAAVLLLLVFGPRVAGHAHGAGLLEPLERIDVRAAGPGFVPFPDETERFALEGERVAAGDPLVVLDNPELRATARTAGFELAALGLDVTRLQARGEAAAAASRRSERIALASRRDTLGLLEDALALRAPIAGVVLTPRLQDRAGSWLGAGEVWCTIGRTDRLRLRVPLTQRDLGLIAERSSADVMALHLPGRSFPARVARLPAGRRAPTPPPYPPSPPPATGPSGATVGAPAGGPSAPATTAAAAALAPAGGVPGSLEVVIEVDNAEGWLRPGMTAWVRIYGEPLTPAGHAARWARRLFKGKVWW